MYLRIEFESENAAFDDNEGVTETIRILKAITERIAERDEGNFVVKDVNGNTVGDWSFGPNEPEVQEEEPADCDDFDNDLGECLDE